MKARAFCPAHITGFFKAELDQKDQICGIWRVLH